jgi:hypothetical protein
MKGSMIRVFTITLFVFTAMTGPVCALDDVADLPEAKNEVQTESKTEDQPEENAESKTETAQEPVPQATETTTDSPVVVTEDTWTEPMTTDKPLTPEPAPIAKDYEVRQNGNNLELITPYGRKLIFGDYGFKNQHDYKFSIPLDALRPAPLKAEEKPTDRQVANVAPPNPKDDEKSGADKKSSSLNDAVPPRVIVEYDYSDRLILEANRLYNRRKFYEASLTIEELLTKRPDYPRGWVMKGSLMYVQGHRDLAKQAWEKALELDPQNSQVKQYLGRLK